MSSEVVRKKHSVGVPSVQIEASFEDTVQAFVNSLHPNNNFVEVVLTTNTTLKHFATGISPDGKSIILDRTHSVPLAYLKSISGHGVSISRESFIRDHNPIADALLPKRGTY